MKLNIRMEEGTVVNFEQINEFQMEQTVGNVGSVNMQTS